MKAYEEVVKERYDGREVEYTLYENPYALINPIGFYGSMRIRQALYKVLLELRGRGIDLAEEKILDVGCGKGDLTRYFTDLFLNPGAIYGMDLSQYRITQARSLHPAINYFVDDIVQMKNTNIFEDTSFGLVTAADVFMHLNTEEQLICSLENIHRLLKEGGIFIWYDAVAKDHFASDQDDEVQGFHPKQMIELSQKAGFKMLFSHPVFKNVIWRYHSAYLTKKFPMWLVSLAESILPGPPGNIVMVFQKAAKMLQ